MVGLELLCSVKMYIKHHPELLFHLRCMHSCRGKGSVTVIICGEDIAADDKHVESWCPPISCEDPLLKCCILQLLACVLLCDVVLPSSKFNCLLDSCLLGGGLDFSVSGDTPVHALVSLVRFKGPLFSATRVS